MLGDGLAPEACGDHGLERRLDSRIGRQTVRVGRRALPDRRGRAGAAVCAGLRYRCAVARFYNLGCGSRSQFHPGLPLRPGWRGLRLLQYLLLRSPEL
ncbi:hypothetical protein ACFFX0_09865 [Citricoccus parietis]|uniref:Uncharacterized protein n=1 Tax=Citricoccus parietis TaxID=592307 RepID=A0ABV5FXS8_9MICC